MQDICIISLNLHRYSAALVPGLSYVYVCTVSSYLTSVATAVPRASATALSTAAVLRVSATRLCPHRWCQGARTPPFPRRWRRGSWSWSRSRRWYSGPRLQSSPRDLLHGCGAESLVRGLVHGGGAKGLVCGLVYKWQQGYLGGSTAASSVAEGPGNSDGLSCDGDNVEDLRRSLRPALP